MRRNPEDIIIPNRPTPENGTVGSTAQQIICYPSGVSLMLQSEQARYSDEGNITGA